MEAADDADPNPLGDELVGVLADGAVDQAEQAGDLVVGPAPVLAAEDIQGEDLDPLSGATRTIGRIASTPWTCPAMAGRPRAAAQRRLPSAMMATCRGCSRSGSASDLHHFGFFALAALVDGLDEAVRHALQASSSRRSSSSDRLPSRRPFFR